MRYIKLNHAQNFRDLGGYPTKDGKTTRCGVIFRSDALCHLDDNDQITLRGLNINTVFDLREAFELQMSGGADRLWAECRLVEVPTSIGVSEVLRSGQYQSGVHTLRFFYVDSFASRQQYHADLFKQVTDPANHPVVFHCTAGKDRTGIFAALLLRIAGVSDEDIIADYAETEKNASGKANTTMRGFLYKMGLDDAGIDDIFGSHPDNIRNLLQHLDEVYASAENYLMGGGVTAEEIERFKVLFVE